MGDIFISQAKDPGWFEGPHQLHCVLPNDLHMVKVSGVVKVVDAAGTYYKGQSSDTWRVDTLHLGLVLPPPFHNSWFKMEAWTPFVTLNSIYNGGQAVNAGWAVDKFILDTYQENKVHGQVSVLVDLAVRDSDGYIFRLGYDVTILGRPTSPLPPPG